MKLKYFFIFVLALTAALATTSCTDTDSIAGGAEGDSAMRTFTFNVTTGDGGAQTRAAVAPVVTGYDMQYILQVLDAEGRTLDLGSGDTQQTNTNGQFAVKLPVGKVYTCLFWAQYVPTGTATSDFFTTTDLRAVTLKQPLTSGDESQAFSATAEIPAAPTQANVEVVLKRAVAQVNLKSGVQMQNYSKVKATYTDVPDQFNVKTGAITLSGSNNTATFEATDFTAAADASGKYPFHSAYVLAQGDGNANMLTAQLEIFNTASTTVAIQTVNISDVPTKRNYRTNIVNTFTSATTAHTYMLDYEEWEGTLSPPSLWDGVIPLSDETATFGKAGRDGSTPENAYVIASAADLAQLTANVSGRISYDGKYFEQTVDIDLNGTNYNWKPIGTYSYPFAGHYNGNGHTISNLSVMGSSNNYSGLFGYVKGANISLKNIHVSGSVKQYQAAGICAHFEGTNAISTSTGETQTISGCSFTGSVTGGESNYRVGGICARAKNAIITSCANYGDITLVEEMTRIGGVLGEGENCIVAGCYNAGHLSYTHNSEYMTIGCIATVDNASSIVGCYNIGTVDLTGIQASRGECSIGSGSNNISISDCYAVAPINGDDFKTGITAFGSSWITDTSVTWAIGAAKDGSFSYGSGTFSNCNFWKSLGGWNGGGSAVVYPKLWWEE